MFVCQFSNNQSSYVETGIRSMGWRSNQQQTVHRNSNNIQNNHGGNQGGRKLPQTPKTPSTLTGHFAGTQVTFVSSWQVHLLSS